VHRSRLRRVRRVREAPLIHPCRTPNHHSSGASSTTQRVSIRVAPLTSADPLRQLDDDPLWAADVAEPIDVFVVLHLANELSAASSHGGDGGVEVVGCECEMADARRVRRRVPVAPRTEGAWNSPARADRGRPGVSPPSRSPPGSPRARPRGLPNPLDHRLALQLESEFDEERRRGVEVVDHDAHVVHALDRHALDCSATHRRVGRRFTTLARSVDIPARGPSEGSALPEWFTRSSRRTFWRKYRSQAFRVRALTRLLIVGSLQGPASGDTQGEVLDRGYDR
jgi:hypothetical protein